MIKIFSIKEIVQASNKILNSSSQKPDNLEKKIIKHNKLITKVPNNTIFNEKMSTAKPLILKKEIQDSEFNKIPDSVDKIIIEAEKKQILESNQETINFNIENKDYDYQKIVDDLYVLLKKKIKKNTLKLIVDLRNNIIELEKKINFSKKKEIKLIKKDKSLRKDIKNLVDLDNKLRSDLKDKNLNIDSLNKTSVKQNEQIIKLKNINIESNSKLDSSLNQNLQLENFNRLLEKDNDKLKSQIDKFQLKIKDLENKNEEFNSKINAFRNQNLKLEEKNKILEKNQNRLNIDIETYQNQIKQLEQINNQANSEINELKEKNDLIKKDFNDLSLKVDELEKLKQYKYKFLEYKQKNSDLENTLDELRVNDDKNHRNYNIITTLKEKIEFYQEENVRLGNELFETKKKFDISKNEIEKYEKEKSNLILKMNSVNEVINNSNILTNVFKNNVKPKINIVDHNEINKEEKKEDLNLNEMVKNIFSKEN